MFLPGQQVPSESNLASQLGISRPTLREALFNLEQEGGIFVTPAYDHRLDSGRLESILALAEITAINADRMLAGHLEVDPGRAVLLLSETLFTEELEPIEFSRNYFLPDFFDVHILRR